MHNNPPQKKLGFFLSGNLTKLFFYLAIIILSVIIARRNTFRPWPNLTNIIEQDPMHSIADHFRPAAAYLPPKGKYGFFSNTSNAITELLFVNFCLAPRIFAADLNHDYILINFPESPDEWLNKNNLSVVTKISDSLYICKHNK